MCCIFTCCGWVLDLVQRFWTFTMSCCIAGAGGCIIVTSSVSGIAMGYNYALAEYVDLKETNVSIYLKRGVFDDEIQDDMDWRRAGHMPIAGHIASDNLRTGLPADDETPPLRSGRRLDDSVYQGDVNNQYEGSLMKMTAKIPLQDSTLHRTTNTESEAIRAQFSEGSLNELKAIQSLIDARRYMGVTERNLVKQADLTTQFVPRWQESADSGLRRQNDPGLNGGSRPNGLENIGISHIETPKPLLMANLMATQMDGQEAIRKFRPGANHMDGPGIRRMGEHEVVTTNPDGQLADQIYWLSPKVPYLFNTVIDKGFVSVSYPSPIPLKDELNSISSASKTVNVQTLGITRTPFAPGSPLRTVPAGFEDEDTRLEQFKEELLLADPRQMNVIPKNDKPKISTDEEYEDEIKGLPVRRRRSIKQKATNINDYQIHIYKNGTQYSQLGNKTTEHNNVRSSETIVSKAYKAIHSYLTDKDESAVKNNSRNVIIVQVKNQANQTRMQKNLTLATSIF